MFKDLMFTPEEVFVLRDAVIEYSVKLRTVNGVVYAEKDFLKLPDLSERRIRNYKLAASLAKTFKQSTGG